jgi:hypothetical protein
MKTTIQANITGYEGKPATLFSLYDADTGVIALSTLVDFKPEQKFTDSLMIGNDPRYQVDFNFSTDMLRDSIKAYYELKNALAADDKSSRLAWGTKAMNADPINAIQVDGYDDRGVKYRLDNLTNAHVATLATCLWATKSRGVAIALDAQDAMVDTLINGGMVSLGGIKKEHSPFVERSFLFGWQADPFLMREEHAKAASRLYGSES